MSTHRSVCPLDCPDACSVLLEVEDGKLLNLTGNPEHPVTKGFACVKTYHYPERQQHPERLLYPQRRVGPKGEGRFERTSWDEALNTIARNLKEITEQNGAEAILPYSYAGTMGLIERDHPYAFFRALGASELTFGTICATTGGAGWEANYGPDKLSPDPEWAGRARFIILWGINSLRSNSHLTPMLKAARNKGAHILHIDPYFNETSRFADEHWQIRPGTDAALALAMGQVILEEGLEDEAYLERTAKGLSAYRETVKAWTPERAAALCGLDAARIREVARGYAKARPSLIRVGYGMTRNEGGGNAMRAVTLLPALTGAWQYEGGGASLSTSGGFPLNKTRYSGLHLRKEGVRTVNQNHLATALEPSQTTKALVVFNSNPAAVAPDSSRVRQGLKREDLFTVVLEHFQTDTADYADYLLPATTFVEHPDLYTAYGHYYVQWAEPALPPSGECKPNSWVFKELSRRLGLKDETLYWSSEALARDLLTSDHPFLKGITLERLKAEGFIKLDLPRPFLPYADGSHFEDKKIRFSPAPEQLTFEEQPSPAYPLRLISPPGSHVLNTSMGNLAGLIKAAGGEPEMLLHPRDAARFGVLDGERHFIESAQGSIWRKITVTEDAPEGTLIALGQWWPKLSPDGKSLNDLTSERLTDLGAGSTFGNVTVRVRATGF